MSQLLRRRFHMAEQLITPGLIGIWPRPHNEDSIRKPWEEMTSLGNLMSLFGKDVQED
jgi:hypothetical protein